MRPEQRHKLSAFAAGLLAHEAEIRAWLRSSVGAPEDVDDVIQEAYCRAWAARDREPVANYRAFFFQVVRNILIDQIRRARVVKIEAVADLEAFAQRQDDPSPERIAAGRIELARVRLFMRALPERCRRVLELRRIEGLSQLEIARRLGVSESVVENEAAKGLRLLLAAMEAEGMGRPPRRARRGVFPSALGRRP